MTGPRPLDPPDTPWRRAKGLSISGVRIDRFERDVEDGGLSALVGNEPAGLHLSMSFRPGPGHFLRYPTWDEIAHARYALLPADREFVMHLPPPGEYVAVHPTTFHLHEHPPRTLSGP